VCVLAATGCGATSRSPETGGQPAIPARPAIDSWTAPAGTHDVESNGGAWRITYRTDPAPPERGQPFSVEAWVFAAAEPDRPREDVALRIDAAMPQHQHGMNRVPTISSSDAGGFRAQGLLFHMAGRWELYFDVTQGAVTERAQVELVVE
jgi:hypothetical protein